MRKTRMTQWKLLTLAGLAAGLIVAACGQERVASPPESRMAGPFQSEVSINDDLLTPACPEDLPRLYLQDVTATCAEMFGTTTTLNVLPPPATNVPASFGCNGSGQSPPNATFPNEWDPVLYGHPFSVFSASPGVVQLTVTDAYQYRFNAVGKRPTNPGSPILVRCHIDNGSVSINVTVNGPAPQLTSIVLTAPSPWIRVGQNQTVTAAYHDNYNGINLITPTPATTWTSSNASVATVSSSGVVSGVGRGTTTITARVGTVTGTFNLTVSACSAVNISPAGPIGVYRAHAQGITATPVCDAPLDPTQEPVTWTNSAPAFVSLTTGGSGNQIGNVAYVAVGTSTVRACMANGLNPPCSANVTVNAYIAPVTATIEGLTTVPRLALCTWTSTVNGGTPPFTYTWTPANQAIPATGPVYKKSTPATGPLRITLSVRDVNGLTGGTSKNITLTPPAGACPK